jgi:amidase
MDDLAHLDATAQAALVRDGEVSAGALVEAAIDRVESLNPTLNAVVTTMFEEARFEEARATVSGGGLRGPFAGVPFLLKDLGALYAGAPTSAGCRFTQRFVPDHDSGLVARLKGAGLVVVGKTNTPEFGIQPTTEPLLFGPCRNPWDPKRSAGGSSGGRRRRWPRGSCRWRTRATGAVPSASPRRAAACSA